MKNIIIALIIVGGVGFVIFNFVSNNNNYPEVVELNEKDSFTSEDFKLQEDTTPKQENNNIVVTPEEIPVAPTPTEIDIEVAQNENQQFPPSDFIYWAGFYFRIPEGWTGELWMYGNTPQSSGQVGIKLQAPEDLDYGQILVGGPQSQGCGEINNPNYEHFVCVTDNGILSGPQDSQYIQGLPVRTLSTNNEVITQFNNVVEELEETYF